MKSKKDNYNLSASSPTKEPGFISFQSPENDQYYFHFNDEKGVPILFSEGYHSSPNRDKGIASVKKNAPITKRYKEKKDGNKHYFILKAGNHQEIATSRLFSSEVKMKMALEYLQTNISKKTRSISSKSVKAKNGRSSQREIKIPNAPKYSYTIDLYPGNDNQIIRGKIWNTLTKRKGNFSGLDGQSIIDFVKKDIPESIKVSAAQKTVMVAEAKENVPVKLEPKAAVVPTENLNLKIINTNSGKVGNNLISFKKYEILLSLIEKSTSTLPSLGGKLRFEANLSSIGNSKPFSSWTEVAEVGVDGVLRLSEFPSIPYTGMYRLNVRSQLGNTGNTGNTIYGSTVLNVN